MTIKIEMKPITCEIEIPGYGKFQVKPLGAGAEAELRILSRRFSEMADRIKKYDGIIEREEKGEKIDHQSKEWKDAVNDYTEAGRLADELKDASYVKLRAVFTGKNVDKLFQDFTYKQLLDVYKKVINQ